MKRVVCNKYIMLTIGVILILVLALGNKKIFAKNYKNYDKDFKFIEINYGDTLTSIAYDNIVDDSQIDDYIKEVKTINHLVGDEIHYGNTLLVPTYIMR